MSPSFLVRTASSRPRSDDRVVCLPRGDSLLVGVADGSGGLRGGADAAERAVRTLAEWSGTPSRGGLETLLVHLDAELHDASVGETAAVLVLVGPAGVYGASAGDSFALLRTDRGVTLLTDGQSRRRLGTGKASPASFASAGTGRLLVATDGLVARGDAEVLHVLTRVRDLDAAADALLAGARGYDERYPDDVAFALVDITPDPSTRPVERLLR